MKPTVKAFFDKTTSTLTYVLYDEETKSCVVIDPVWDYDQASSKLSTPSIDGVISFLKSNHLTLHLVMETHAHADHLSGSQLLKRQYPTARIAIGESITEVQKVFKDIYHLRNDFPTDGSQFDLLLKDGQTIAAGSLSVQAISTPGHTPACMSYVIGDSVFSGDALFLPDSGTGRCDFPAGSAEALYTSIHEKLYRLPDTHRVFVGHDYQPNGRTVQFESTIGDEKKNNIHLKETTSREEFVKFRTTRDAGLAAPKLLLPSLQVNINAGHLPPPEDNGKSYLKIPLF